MSRLRRSRSLRLAIGKLVIAVCSVILISQIAAAESSSEDALQLEFAMTEYDNVREGYVTLEWNSVSDAARYEVIDSDGRVVYSGTFERAFLSGLDDGQYRYEVRALSETGDVMFTSKEPVLVTVRHWPLRYVAALFSTGLVVVLSVAVVIIRGASSAAETELAETELAETELAE